MPDHDQRFKILLQTFLREFIALFFPQWLDRFDWSNVEWLQQEAFLEPPQGRRRAMDLIAKLSLLNPVQTSEREPESSLILIHVEVDSSEGVAEVPHSMCGYYSWLRVNKRLPVFPIGLYLRTGLDGVGWGSHREGIWEEKLLDFRFPYIGLPALDAMTYLEGNNWLGVALSVLMRMPESEKARIKADAMQRLATSPLDAARRFLLCECVEAYLPLEGPHLTEYDQLLLTEKYQEANMVGKTSYEKGMEKGMEKGEETGIEKGQVAILLPLLQDRFGSIDEEVRNRLVSMTVSQREQIASKILRANSLGDLGLE